MANGLEASWESRDGRTERGFVSGGNSHCTQPRSQSGVGAPLLISQQAAFLSCLNGFPPY